jgi:hypothetical protein
MPRPASTLILLAALVAFLAACTQSVEPNVSSVAIVGGNRTVPLGTTAVLTPQVVVQGGAATTVSWTSSVPGVVSVSTGGVVSALVEGTSIVTATSTVDPTKSASVTVTAAYAIVGTLLDAGDVAGLSGVALGLTSDDLFAEELSTSRLSLTEIAPGIYLTTAAEVAADGGFVLPLPLQAHLPSDLFAPADDFVINLRDIDACALEASDQDARVTVTAFDFPSPIPALIAMSGAEPVGLIVAFPAPVDLEDPEAEAAILSWVHADRAVTVTSVGEGCTDRIDVDVTLLAGWNQIAWSAVGTDGLELELRSSAAAEVFAAAFVLDF